MANGIRLSKTNHRSVQWQVAISARVTGSKRVRRSFADRERALAFIIRIRMHGFSATENMSGHHELEAWLRSLADQSLPPDTIHSYGDAVRQFFTWCHQGHQIMPPREELRAIADELDRQNTLRKNRRVTADKRKHKRRALAVVYLISDQEAGVFKIGISMNVNDRITALRSESGRNLLLLKSWNCNDSLFVERSLHWTFKEHRIHGEWFRLPADTVQALIATDNLAEYLVADLDRRVQRINSAIG
jgi:Meiotically up-regulated gene 113